MAKGHIRPRGPGWWRFEECRRRHRSGHRAAAACTRSPRYGTSGDAQWPSRNSVGGLESGKSRKFRRPLFLEPSMWTPETRAEHDRDDLATQ